MLGIATRKETNEADLIDYKVGETVKVNYGAFTGMIGTVDEVNKREEEAQGYGKHLRTQDTGAELENSSRAGIVLLLRTRL